MGALRDLLIATGLPAIGGALWVIVKWLTARRDAQQASIDAKAAQLDAATQQELTEAKASLRVAAAERDAALARSESKAALLEAENRRLLTIAYGYIRQMLTHQPPLIPEPPDPHGEADHDGERANGR